MLTFPWASKRTALLNTRCSAPGAIADLRGIGRYARDYPVWTVSVAGSFLARSHPPGHGSDDYGTDTVYLEGYSGAVIDRMHNATPVPFPTPTVVPKRNAPVIDAARALQAVAHFAQGSIRDEGSEPELSTFGHMPAPVSSTLLGRYARDYPVWIVSANAADDQPAGSGKPLLETFYIDGYSGEVLVESRDLATTPTP